jgi:hypothetical protein
VANPGRSRIRIVLSVVGVILAFGLGVLAVCLICFGSTHKQAVLGALAGLWAALLGYVAVYGVRDHHHPIALVGPPADEGLGARVALELAGAREVETTRDAAARRDYEERLQALVHTELTKISEAVADEVSALRDEVSQLRGELVEKVGGQLRLERVETTRVIGSNIEALQHELRRLTVTRDDLATGTPTSSIEHLRPEPAPVPFQPVPVVQVPVVQAPVVQAPLVQAPVVQTPAPTLGSDPFAGLPRLSRFEDDAASDETREIPAVSEPRRRHRHDADEVATPETEAGGGRRRRPDGETNDILQRLLSTRQA